MFTFNSLIVNVYCSMFAWSSLLALILKLWGPSVLHFCSFGVHFVSFGVSKAPFCDFGGPFLEFWGFHWAPFWRFWGPIGRPLAAQRAHVSFVLNCGSFLVSMLGPFCYKKWLKNPPMFLNNFLIDFGTILDDFGSAFWWLLGWFFMKIEN